MKTQSIKLVLTVSSLLFASFSNAGEFKIENLVITDTWTRATPKNASAGGAFLTIYNSGTKPEILVGGSSPASTKVEVHETSIEDGIMKMRHLHQGLTIPSGETIEMAPGGHHIMLIGITEPFTEGDSIPLTLEFKNSGTVDINLDVVRIGAKEMPSNKTHGNH